MGKKKIPLGQPESALRLKKPELASDRTVEYEYDALYRLVKETVTDDNGTTVTEYTYDRNSNRLTKTMDGEITSYIYNELNQLVTETGIIYEYDLNGNLIKKTEACPDHDLHLQRAEQAHKSNSSGRTECQC